MRHYQQLLLTALEQHGWHLDERRTQEDWWVADLWIVSSVRSHHGFRLFCTFLVDPQAERANDLSAVRSIVISSQALSDWRQADAAPVVLYRAQRDFPNELEPAMKRLEQLRSDATDDA